jgi:hypothetical protein
VQDQMDLSLVLAGKGCCPSGFEAEPRCQLIEMTGVVQEQEPYQAYQMGWMKVVAGSSLVSGLLIFRQRG